MRLLALRSFRRHLGPAAALTALLMLGPALALDGWLERCRHGHVGGHHDEAPGGDTAALTAAPCPLLEVTDAFGPVHLLAYVPQVPPRHVPAPASTVALPPPSRPADPVVGRAVPRGPPDAVPTGGASRRGTVLRC